ncbi:pentapeptide repeat-containing protein [Streptomyces sp. NBC_01378]|uniref:pentapeptide repeat-containing protein n=1 Tax=Streptomyces sp. NBC_01378 TaxID=2903844 RepID=UPI00324F0044
MEMRQDGGALTHHEAIAVTVGWAVIPAIIGAAAGYVITEQIQANLANTNLTRAQLNDADLTGAAPACAART